jgi:hypothetical protein
LLHAVLLLIELNSARLGNAVRIVIAPDKFKVPSAREKRPGVSPPVSGKREPTPR